MEVAGDGEEPCTSNEPLMQQGESHSPLNNGGHNKEQDFLAWRVAGGSVIGMCAKMSEGKFRLAHRPSPILNIPTERAACGSPGEREVSQRLAL